MQDLLNLISLILMVGFRSFDIEDKGKHPLTSKYLKPEKKEEALVLTRIRLFDLLIIFFIFDIGLFFISCDSEVNVQNSWTIMVYGDGDNNLEYCLLKDIEEMKQGYNNNQGMSLIVLVDRIPGESSNKSILGSNFTDTQLYRITHNKATRLNGMEEFPEITKESKFEANMGDANTLKKFIKYCKKNYTADHYALILWNHGGGIRSIDDSSIDDRISKAVCWDTSNNNDSLYTAEINDVLTEEESVDLLGFDACLMGAVEVAYQYRPGNGGFYANAMVASPPLEWGDGWKYDDILKRIKASGRDNKEIDTVMGGGESNELYYDPATMTALQLGGIIVEEQYDSTSNSVRYEPTQALSCYDLTRVEEVKIAVDNLSIRLYFEDEKEDFENIRWDWTNNNGTMNYFEAVERNRWWIVCPGFDLYDLFERTANSSNFSSTIQDLSSAVMSAVDEMVVYSYGGSSYSEFKNGKNGIYIFFTDGDTLSSSSYRIWRYQWWYNAIDTATEYSSGNYYGKIKWCIDGAIQDNRQVENWFELLDVWFDDPAMRNGESWNSYNY